MQFTARCQEVRNYLYGTESLAKIETSFLVEPGSECPGFLIIRTPTDAGLKVGDTVTLTVEKDA